MYTNDPANNPLDRVRILCTDTDNDELLIEQSVLEFFYESSNRNEKLAARRALEYLLFQVAKMGDEKVGGVYLRNSGRYKNLKDAYNILLKGSWMGGKPYAGGISVSDIEMRRHNPDSIKKATEQGDSFDYYTRDRYNNDDPDSVIVIQPSCDRD